MKTKFEYRELDYWKEINPYYMGYGKCTSVDAIAELEKIIVKSIVNDIRNSTDSIESESIDEALLLML